MKLTKALLFLIIQNLALTAFGQLNQQNLIYSNYYLNPYLYNPSIIAPSGYTELALNYRQQWTGFSGAPKTATLNLQMPLSYKAAIGINVYNDQAGVLQTNTGLISYAYQVYLGRNLKDLHKLAFGVSAGVTNSYLSKTNVANASTDATLVTTSISNFDGQFGISYQLHNFKLGFSLPRLLKSKAVTDGSFTFAGIDPVASTITTASYNFQLSPKIAFEPIAMYRTEGVLHWFEGFGVLKIDDIAWIGGSYRQDVGPAAFLGFNIKDKFKIGYAYEFATGAIGGLGNGTHEVQLILRLSKNKKVKPQPKEEVKEEEPKEETVEETKTEEPKESVAIVPKEEPNPTVIPSEQKVTPEEPVRPTIETAEKPIQQIEHQNENQVIPADEKSQEPVVAETQTKKTSLDGNNLIPGHYVVVGAFQSSVNAKKYSALLKRSGYPADVAFDPVKKYYFVHMGNVQTVEEARRLRDVYRQKSRYSFKDTWILSIE